jgi:excisionase family DNA binding protein
MGTAVDHADPGTMLRPAQVASLFNMSPKTVGRWHAAGILVGVRTAGGHRRFRAQDVFELLEFLEEVGEP